VVALTACHKDSSGARALRDVGQFAGRELSRNRKQNGPGSATGKKCEHEVIRYLRGCQQHVTFKNAGCGERTRPSS
jgi:hypothetical protein